MLCPRPTPLNAGATVVLKPLPHHQRPSRAAGSCFGQFQPWPVAKRHSSAQNSAERGGGAEGAKSALEGNNSLSDCHV